LINANRLFRIWMLRDGETRQFAPDPPQDDPAVG